MRKQAYDKAKQAIRLAKLKVNEDILKIKEAEENLQKIVEAQRGMGSEPSHSKREVVVLREKREKYKKHLQNLEDKLKETTDESKTKEIKDKIEMQQEEIDDLTDQIHQA